MLPRRALVLAGLLVSLTGCTAQTQLLNQVRGHANGLAVYSVRSIDDAWLVRDKGLVILGQVVWGGEFDDPWASPQPRLAAFAAALSLQELRSRQPLQLSYERLYSANDADQSCPGSLVGVQRVSVSAGPGVELVNPEGAAPRDVRLEQQRIRIGPLQDVTSAPRDVVLGPRGGEPAMLALWPLSFASDLVGLVTWPLTWLFSGREVAAEPRDPCAQFTEALFRPPHAPAAPPPASSASVVAAPEPAPVSSP